MAGLLGQDSVQRTFQNEECGQSYHTYMGLTRSGDVGIRMGAQACGHTELAFLRETSRLVNKYIRKRQGCNVKQEV